jgi:hypothetical protein
VCYGIAHKTSQSEAWYWWYIPEWQDVSSYTSFHIYPCAALCTSSPVNATQLTGAQTLLAKNIEAARKVSAALPLMIGEFGVAGLSPTDRAWFYHSMYNALRAADLGSLFWDLSVSERTYGVLNPDYSLTPAAVSIAAELANRTL